MNAPGPEQRAPGEEDGGGRSAPPHVGQRRRGEVVGPAVVRGATAADVSRVSEIEQEAFSDPWSRSAFERLVVENDPRVLFDVASLPNGQVVGYVVAWFILDEGEIANLAVSLDARARGIGKALLTAAIAAARSREVGTIYLEVRDSNAAARALYASHGFEEIGRRRRYYRRPVEDALVLRLVLPGP
jgi:ribosomal-protein-alanine N-acetyltransferase